MDREKLSLTELVSHLNNIAKNGPNTKSAWVYNITVLNTYFHKIGLKQMICHHNYWSSGASVMKGSESKFCLMFWS